VGWVVGDVGAREGGTRRFSGRGAGDKEARALSAAEGGEDRRGWPRLTAAPTFLLHSLNSAVRSSLPIPILSLSPPPPDPRPPSSHGCHIHHHGRCPRLLRSRQGPLLLPPSLLRIACSLHLYMGQSHHNHQYTSGGFRTISM